MGEVVLVLLIFWTQIERGECELLESMIYKITLKKANKIPNIQKNNPPIDGNLHMSLNRHSLVTVRHQ